MTDSTVQGPFPLPVATYNPRGEWQPATGYLINDLVSAGGTLYVVTWNHTSEATFDPGANDGAGHDFYAVFMEAPQSVIPAGGLFRQVLGKLSNTDFDVAWIGGLLPLAGTIGQVLAKNSNSDLDVGWTSLPSGGSSLPMSTISAANYTYVLGDAGTYIRFTAAGSLGITIPNNAAVA